MKCFLKFDQLVLSAAIILLFVAGQTKAQNALTLKAIGNGEKVKISANGKSKIVDLENGLAGDFIAGGEPPHRYTILLSGRKDDSFYLIAKFRSGAAVSNPNAPCGGDAPQTLLLIEANKNLSITKVQTEVFASCIYSGAGRYTEGNPQITKDKVSIKFNEGRKNIR